MIAFLKGYVDKIGDGVVYFDCNNMGYELLCSTNTIIKIQDKKDLIKLYTYLNINGRDGELSFYGFYSEEEKEMFLQLTSISGIGGKLALTILSGMSLNQLILAISSGDIKTLSTIKGLGKKTAERLIVELRDKLGGVYSIGNSSIELIKDVTNNDSFSNVVDLLVDMGFTKTEAQTAVLSASKETTDVAKMVEIAIKNRFNGK